LYLIVSFLSSFLLYVSAKKLPKNEQVAGAGTSGQGRRLVESEGQQKVPGNCCKWSVSRALWIFFKTHV